MTAFECRTYNPEDGRALKKAATQEEAMKELVDVVSFLVGDRGHMGKAGGLLTLLHAHVRSGVQAKA